MKREHLAFLVGGVRLRRAVRVRGRLRRRESARSRAPSLPAQARSRRPRGPAAPTQRGGDPSGGGAPMVAESTSSSARSQRNRRTFELLLRLADLYHRAGMWEQAGGVLRARRRDRAERLRTDDRPRHVLSGDGRVRPCARSVRSRAPRSNRATGSRCSTRSVVAAHSRRGGRRWRRWPRSRRSRRLATASRAHAQMRRPRDWREQGAGDGQDPVRGAA